MKILISILLVFTVASIMITNAYAIELKEYSLTYQNYYNSEYDFYLNIPNGWYENKPPDNDVILYLEDGKNEVFRTVWVLVENDFVRNVSGQQYFDEMLNKYENMCIEQHGSDDCAWFKEKETHQINIGGYLAYEARYTYSTIRGDNNYTELFNIVATEIPIKNNTWTIAGQSILPIYSIREISGTFQLGDEIHIKQTKIDQITNKFESLLNSELENEINSIHGKYVLIVNTNGKWGGTILDSNSKTRTLDMQGSTKVFFECNRQGVEPVVFVDVYPKQRGDNTFFGSAILHKGKLLSINFSPDTLQFPLDPAYNFWGTCKDETVNSSDSGFLSYELVAEPPEQVNPSKSIQVISDTGEEKTMELKTLNPKPEVKTTWIDNLVNALKAIFGF